MQQHQQQRQQQQQWRAAGLSAPEAAAAASGGAQQVVANLRQSMAHVRAMAARAARDNKLLTAENEQLVAERAQQQESLQQLQVG